MTPPRLLTVKLYTRSGDFVATTEVPPFVIPPDVIVWGDRCFVAPYVTDAVRLAELAVGEIGYVEGLMFVITPIHEPQPSLPRDPRDWPPEAGV